MKVVSVSEWNDELIMGYVDSGRGYRSFTLTPGARVRYGEIMSKKRFGLVSLEHFAGVIGKFDPDAFVLDEPLVVKKMGFAALEKILSGDDRFQKLE